MKRETLRVTIRLLSGNITLEILAPVGASDDEIFDLAIAELQKEIEIAKLGSYRAINY